MVPESEGSQALLILSESGIEHAKEPLRRARVGCVCQHRAQHKCKVRKFSRACTVSELPVRFRGCWRVRAHARPGSRARGTRDRTIGTLAAPFELAARGARCAECSSCPGADAGGRAPAKPRALTPTRPRVRVPALSVLAPGCVRRRWCSRTPSVNRARAPRAPTKCTGIFPEFFFPCADGWSRSRSRPLSLPVRVPGKKLTKKSKVHRPSAVAYSDSE